MTISIILNLSCFFATGKRGEEYRSYCSNSLQADRSGGQTQLWAWFFIPVETGLFPLSFLYNGYRFISKGRAVVA